MTRERLPEDRPGFTRAFRLKYVDKEDGKDVVKELKLYFTANFYEGETPDQVGKPGEIFISADQTGSFTRGALDAFAMMFSMALQHGASIESIVAKLKGSQFGPSGRIFVDGPEGEPVLDAQIPRCTSPFDLLARWLEIKFVPEEKRS